MVKSSRSHTAKTMQTTLFRDFLPPTTISLLHWAPFTVRNNAGERVDNEY